jgi:hypothetical protein
VHAAAQVELLVRVPADDDALVDPASIGASRSRGVARVIRSSSSRGEPWQNSVGPRPSMFSVTVGSNAARKSRSARPRARTHEFSSSPASKSRTISRSQLPIT